MLNDADGAVAHFSAALATDPDLLSARQGLEMAGALHKSARVRSDTGPNPRAD
jgi:hypothetical protein